MPPSFRSRFKSFTRIFWWLAFLAGLWLSWYVGPAGRIPLIATFVLMLLLYPWCKSSAREPLQLPIAAMLAHATWFFWASITTNRWSGATTAAVTYCVASLVLMIFPRRWPILVIGLICATDFVVSGFELLSTTAATEAHQVKAMDWWLDGFSSLPLLLEFIRLEIERGYERRKLRVADEADDETGTDSDPDEPGDTPTNPRGPVRNVSRRGARPGQDPRKRT